MNSNEVLDSIESNACNKCSKPRLQNYILCDKCLKKKKALAAFGVIIAFLFFNSTFACITYYVAIAFNLNSYFSLGSLFWCLLLPYLIKKARSKVDEKYKLKESDEAIPQAHTPAHPDIQFPKYTEEENKKNERDKLLKRISDLYRENEELKKRKPKKAFVAIIVVLSVLLASVSGLAVYQQTQIQKISDKLDWKIKNYESSIASLNEENDELRNNWYDACDELMLYHNSVAITVGQGIYYHKANCDIVQSALNTSINCRINTKKALKAQGYIPCPDCYPLDK